MPELNGYGSAEWLTAFIRDPGHEQFYGEKNQMPAFADKMSTRDLDLLVRYLTGAYATTAIHAYPTIDTQSSPAGGTVEKPQASTGAGADAATRPNG